MIVIKAQIVAYFFLSLLELVVKLIEACSRFEALIKFSNKKYYREN